MKRTVIFNILISFIFISSISSVYLLNNNKNIILETEIGILNEKNKFLEKQQLETFSKVGEYINFSENRFSDLLKTLEIQDENFLSRMNQMKKEQEEITSLSFKTDSLFAENLKIIGDKVINSEDLKQRLIKK